MTNQTIAEYVWQIILTSGIIGTIISVTTSKLINRRFDELDAKKKSQAKYEGLLLKKIDKLSDLVELMARKLHDAGVINGDLERIRTLYHTADEEFDQYMNEVVVKENLK
jgi:hypothetical protein